MGDLPPSVLHDQYPAAPGLAKPRVVEALVEPRRLPIWHHGNVPFKYPVGPTGPGIEASLRVRHERWALPTLGGVGAEKDRLARIEAEVAIEVRIGCSLMEGIQDLCDRLRSARRLSDGRSAISTAPSTVA